jgi:hypothetical protein
MNEISNFPRRVAVVSALLMTALLAACSDSAIKAAKHEPFPGRSGTTFEKVLDNYQWCNKKKWDSKELKTGEKYVEFTCIATEPNVKVAIASYIAEQDKEKAKDMAKIDEAFDVSVNAARNSAYKKRRGAEFFLAHNEERLQTFDQSSPNERTSAFRQELVESVERSRAEVAAYNDPEYVAQAEAHIQKEQLVIDAAIAKQREQVEAESARRQEALTDGTIKMVFQWQLTQGGSVGHYAMAVVFDFGNRQYTVDGEDGIANSMLATIYEDKPILNGMRQMLNNVAVINAPDGMILFTASRRSLDSMNGRK